jgi:hypothetical protein
MHLIHPRIGEASMPHVERRAKSAGGVLMKLACARQRPPHAVSTSGRAR